MIAEPRDSSDDYITKGLRSALRGSGTDAHARGTSPSTDDVPDVPPLVPGLRIEGLIGRGGIGLVYRARDLTLGRAVAVKVLASRHAGDDELIARFRAEARIGSQLQHPGVVPVHAVGELDDGRPFFTMKVIEGFTLAERLRARAELADDRHEHLSTFLKVCQTIAYAHARGVVHGDLKPSNVMVGEFGETQVMDWGFARAAAADEEATRAIEGAIEHGSARLRPLGTPAYMAPEQAHGDRAAVTPKADVFGLGGILAEILTGQPTYVAPSRQALRDLAARGETGPTFARLHDAGADVDLVAIAVRCLAKDPSERPDDAVEVAELVQDYLQAGDARARALEHEVERARRVRATILVVAASVLVALTAIFALAAWWQHDRNRWLRDTERVVGDSMATARNLAERARLQPPQRLEHWDEAIASARHANRLARTGVSRELQRGASALLDELESAARDARRLQRMAFWLDEVRPHLPADRGGSVDADYAAAFVEFGLDVESGPMRALGSEIRSSPLADGLIAALDDWSRMRRRQMFGSRGDWRRLLAINNFADDDPWRRRLRAALEHGDAAELVALASAPDVSHASSAAVTLLASCLADSGEAELARELLRREMRTRPPDVSMLHELARFAEKDSDEGRTEVMWLRMAAMAMRPQSPHLLTDFAHALISVHEPQWAEEVLQRATEIDPDYTRAWRYLAWARMKLARNKASAQAANRALAQDDSDAEAHHLRAVAASQLGDYATARFHAERALQLGASWPTGLIFALICEQQGDSRAALAAIDAVLTEAPSLVIAQLIRGAMLVRFGEFERAAELFRQVAAANADSDVAERCGVQARRAELLAAAAAQLDVWGLDAGYVASAELEMFAEVAWIRGDAVLALRLLRRLAAEDPERFAEHRRLAIEVAAAVGRTIGVGTAERVEVDRDLLAWLREEIVRQWLRLENAQSSASEIAAWAATMLQGPMLATYLQAVEPAAAGPLPREWEDLRGSLDRLATEATVRSSGIERR